MNKIRLNNIHEFELVSLGYMRDDAKKTVSFRFSSGLSIGEVQAVFKDIDAISSIEYILSNGAVKEVIADCVAYQSITQDSEGYYIVILSTDKMSADLAATQSELAAAKGQLESADMLIRALSDTIVLISMG